MGITPGITKGQIQMVGLLCLTLLSVILLVLIGYLFGHAIEHVTQDGKVPVLDAGVLTACLLAFQNIIAAIRSIWESQERTALAEGLSNSTPQASPNPPAGNGGTE